MLSSTPVTITLTPVFQFVAFRVTEDAQREISSVHPVISRGITTSAVGAERRVKLIEAVPHVSSVIPSVISTTTHGASLF